MHELFRRAGGRVCPVAVLIGCALVLGACGPEAAAPEPAPRPVRTITVTPPQPREAVALTGRIEAQDQPSLAFRIAGRMAQRLVDVGQSVRPGQIVARLEPQNELNALRSAEAALATARGLLVQAENRLERQRALLARGVTSQAYFESAEQSRKAAAAQVEAAEAQRHTAEEFVRFTTLKADAQGVVTAVGAEPGEVVQAGQRVVQLARRGGRDAVFDVPAHLLPTLDLDASLTMTASGNPAVVAGRVREVSPQADPVTRTFQIRVGLIDPPETFRLGTAVTGTLTPENGDLLTVPATALVPGQEPPRLWVVDPATGKVARRDIALARLEAATAFIEKGLAAGDIVVTAGVASLRDGQGVRLEGEVR